MSRPSALLRPRRRLCLALLMGLIALIAGPGVVATLRQSADPLRFAVEQIRQRGAYAYDARIVTTITPQPRLEHAGRSPQQQMLAVRGQADVHRGVYDLAIVQGDGSLASGGDLQIRIAAGRAESRSGDGPWQALDLPVDALAPTGDFLGLLGAGRDVRLVERTHLAGRELTRYSFRIDGAALADLMQQELERTLRAQNRLAPGTRPAPLDRYRTATGSGEILVDAGGLPVRQIIRLSIPDEQRGQTVEGTITIDFAGFAPAPALGRPWAWAHTIAWNALALHLGLLTVVALLMALLVRARRTRPVYLTVTGLTIAAMLATPLLQAGRLTALATEAAAAAPAAPAAPEPAPAALEPAHQSAARAAAFALAANLAAGVDSDGDGLSDSVESALGTAPARSDTDDDGLSDSSEALELGTRPTVFDTDGDGLGDGLESEPIVGPDGRTFYLDPFQADTNRDGQNDFVECVGASYCPDTDGDGVPNAWDSDNDNDGVPDRLDAAPTSVVSGGANPDGSLRGVPDGTFSLTVNDSRPGLPLLVDFTVRPLNPSRLWYVGSVLDWPTDDRTGQIQRVFDTTLGPSGNLADGDMRLQPMLEIGIPYVPGSFGGLPVKPSYTGADLPSLAGVDLADPTATAAWFGQWLDQERLAAYQATVRIDRVIDGRPTFLVYLPLELLRDGIGGAPVAFTARMFYRPASIINGHTVRLAWSLQIQTDQCTPPPAADSPDGERYSIERWNALPADQTAGQSRTAWAELSAAERARIWCEGTANWRTNPTPTLAHTYYDDFYLSALTVSEEQGIVVGAVGVEPQPDTAPLVQTPLWSLARNLDRTFVGGRDCDAVVDGACQGDGRRDITVAEIQRRFAGPANAAVDPVARWGITQPLHVEVFNFTDPGDLSRLFFSHRTGATIQAPLLTTWLNRIYAPQRGPTATLNTPTILVARERTFRSVGLALAAVEPGGVQVSLAGVPVVTQAGLSWQSFTYQGDGNWTTADHRQQAADLQNELAALLAGPGGFADPERAAGGARLLQSYFLSLLHGRTQVVALAGIPAVPASSAVADAAIAAPSAPGAALAALAAAMTELVAANQTHRALLAPADADDLLAALGRQALYQDRSPALSQLQGLGTLQGADVAGYLLAAAMIGVAETVFTPEPEPNTALSAIGDAITNISTTRDLRESVVELYRLVAEARKLVDAAEAAAQTTSLFNEIKTVLSARAAVNTTGELVGTVGDLLDDAGAFGITLTVVTEFFTFAAKLVALAQAGDLTPTAFVDLIAESAAALYVNLIIMGAIAAIVPIGPVVVAVSTILDFITDQICKRTGLDQSDAVLANLFCSGLTDTITRVLLTVFYDRVPVVDLAAPDRLDLTNWRLALRNPQTGADGGFVVGDRLIVSADVVTTLSIASEAQWRTLGNIQPSTLTDATFVYGFTPTEEQGAQRIHERRNVQLGQMTDAWRMRNPEQFAATTPISTGVTFDRAQINWKPAGLYLAEGYTVPALFCQLLACSPDMTSGSNYLSLTDNFSFDVFPGNLDGFYSLTDDDGDGGFRLAWDARFPDLADADGDGLRTVARGGNDPADNSADSDQDGLSDLFELQNAGQGLDPRRADTDGDGLSDLDEIRLQLNPAVADIDNDGLNDGQEIAGWEIVYGYDAQDQPRRFRTSSDPRDPDTDGDGLLDRQERTYGFNPRVFNATEALQIQSRLIQPDGRSDGIVAAGAAIGVTAVVSSTLRDRFALGLFETDLEHTPAKPDLAPSAFRLGPLAAATLDGTPTLPAGGSLQTALLTRAGAIISDLDGLSGGRTLWLRFDEAAGPPFADASPFGHDAACPTGPCATGDAGAYAGRSLLINPGAAPLNVAAASTLAAERFTITAWVNPVLEAQPGAYRTPTGLAPTTLIARRNAVTTSYALDLNWRVAGSAQPGVADATVAARPRLSIGNAACSDAFQLTATRDLPQNRWSQIAAVYDGAQLRLFINGVAAGAAAYNDGLCAQALPLQIGWSANVANPALRAEQTRLDELAFYPTPLSPVAIQGLFRDPVLHLSFTGGASDNSGLRQPTVVGGAGAIPTAAGRDGDQAGVFDKRRWVAVGPSSSLDMSLGAGHFTLAAFIRPNPQLPDRGWQGVIGREDGNATYPSLFVDDAGRMRAAFGTGSAFCDSGATPPLLAAGAWSHVAVSYTGSQFIFFVDGEERARLPSGCPVDSRPIGDQLFIGRTDTAATLTLNQVVVADEGDGIGSAEYAVTWGGERIWSRDDIDVGVYAFDTAFNNGWSNELSLAADAGVRFELIEEDDLFDDTQISLQVQPFMVNAAGSWSYWADGRGRLTWRLWNRWFSGALDDVQVYRTALDAAEVRALYDGLRARSYALRMQLEEPPTTTIFRDGSGNLLTGGCTGAACPTTGLPGRDGQAARFDGDDRISVPGRTALDLADGFTVGAWVHLDEPNAAQVLVDKLDPAAGGFRLSVDAGQVVGEVVDSAGVLRTVRGGSLPARAWVHAALSVSAGRHLSVYVDGVEVGRAALPQTERVDAAVAFPIPGTATLFAEPNYEGGSAVFSGDAADVGVINNLSSAVRINGPCVRAYAEPNYGGAARFICDDTPNLSDFDDTIGSLRLLSTPPAYDAQAQALRLDGTALQHLRLAPAQIGNPFFATLGVAAWVRLNDPRPAAWQTIIARGTADDAEGFRLRITSTGQLNFQAGGGDWTSTGSLPAVEGWHHVAVSVDNATVRFYLDGVAAGSFPFTGSISDTGGQIFIGRLPQCGSRSTCDAFSGYLRDLALFTRPLSAEEIGGLRGAAAGATPGNPEAGGAAPNGRVVFLPFDTPGSGSGGLTFQSITATPLAVNAAPLQIGGAATGGSGARGLIDEVIVLEYPADAAELTALVAEAPRLRLALDEPLGARSFADAAGYAAAACTDAGCPQAGARGRIREAPVFGAQADGTADLLRTPDADRLDLAQFSLELWLRPEAVRSGEQIILAKAAPDGAARNYLLSLIPDSLQLRLSTAGGVVESRRALTLHQWNHVVAGYDGTALRLFINGTPEPAAAASAPALNNAPLSIGGLEAYGVPFSGMIDEVAIYGHPLRPDEVAARYAAQESWFDAVERLPLTIDGDAPTAELSIADGAVIPNAPILTAVAAFDPTSAVSAVFYDDDGDAHADDWKPAVAGADGSGWFFLYTPPGSGSYPLRAYAVDRFGHAGPVAATTVVVDGAPPALTLDAALRAAPLRPQEAQDEGGVWTLPLSGVAVDTLSAPVTVIAALSGPEGNAGPELVVEDVNGAWSGAYRFVYPPNGAYTLRVRAVDAVGNTVEAPPTVLNLDAYAPFATVTVGDTALRSTSGAGAAEQARTTAASTVPLLSGTVIDQPRPAGAVALLQFEEPAGATQFLDSSFAQRSFTCTGNACPSAGAAGRVGNALAFDGRDDTFALPQLDLTRGDLTVALWLHPEGRGTQTPLVAMHAEAPVFELRLDGATLTVLADTGQGLASIGTTSLPPDTWSHIALSFNSATLRAFRNGAPFATLADADIAGFDSLRLGSRDESTAFYTGRIDELTIYGSALSSAMLRLIAAPAQSGVAALEAGLVHLKDRTNPNAVLRLPATLAPGADGLRAWSAPAPQQIEGPYLLSLTSTDALGNTWTQPNVWIGDIDTRAPRAFLYRRDLGDGTALVSCMVEDYNLDVSRITCPAPVGAWVIEHEEADWHRTLYGDAARPVRMSTPVVRVDTAPERITACDSFGNCTTAAASTTLPPTLAGVGLIVAPADRTVATSYDPMTVRGFAGAADGLAALRVRAGAVVFYEPTLNGAATELLWEAPFTPAADGVYPLTVTAVGRDGRTYTDPTAPVLLVDTRAPDLRITGAALQTGQPATLALSALITEATGVVALQVRINGGAWQDLPLPATGVDVAIQAAVQLAQPDGADRQTVTVELRATDVAGRTTTASRTVAIGADSLRYTLMLPLVQR